MILRGKFIYETNSITDAVSNDKISEKVKIKCKGLSNIPSVVRYLKTWTQFLNQSNGFLQTKVFSFLRAYKNP